MSNNENDALEEVREVNEVGSATVSHPWRRYFARTFDLSVYGLIWSAFSHLFLRYSADANGILSLVNFYISCGLMLVIEPFLLAVYGTTPGKWIFGLKIRDLGGKKLNYRQAFQRTFKVFGVGMGYNIPIYNIVREVKCFNICSEPKPLPWEEGFTYTLKDEKLIRVFAYIGLNLIIFGLSYLTLLQAQMPINRGNITAEEYYENCNDFMIYSKLDYGKYLNSQGQWVDYDNDGSSYSIQLFPQALPEHVLTITDGNVSGVRIEIETDQNEWLTGYNSQLYMAYISFVAAQKEMNCIRLNSLDVLQTLSNGFQNYSFTEAGIRISNEVDYSGYDLFDDEYLIPIEGQVQYFHMVFTMEKINP